MGIENKDWFSDTMKVIDGDQEAIKKAEVQVRANAELESQQYKVKKINKVPAVPEIRKSWTDEHEDRQEDYSKKFEGKPGPDAK